MSLVTNDWDYIYNIRLNELNELIASKTTAVTELIKKNIDADIKDLTGIKFEVMPESNYSNIFSKITISSGTFYTANLTKIEIILKISTDWINKTRDDNVLSPIITKTDLEVVEPVVYIGTVSPPQLNNFKKKIISYFNDSIDSTLASTIPRNYTKYYNLFKLLNLMQSVTALKPKQQSFVFGQILGGGVFCINVMISGINIKPPVANLTSVNETKTSLILSKEYLLEKIIKKEFTNPEKALTEWDDVNDSEIKLESFTKNSLVNKVPMDLKSKDYESNSSVPHWLPSPLLSLVTNQIITEKRGGSIEEGNFIIQVENEFIKIILKNVTYNSGKGNWSDVKIDHSYQIFLEKGEDNNLDSKIYNEKFDLKIDYKNNVNDIIDFIIDPVSDVASFFYSKYQQKKLYKQTYDIIDAACIYENHIELMKKSLAKIRKELPEYLKKLEEYQKKEIKNEHYFSQNLKKEDYEGEKSKYYKKVKEKNEQKDITEKIISFFEKKVKGIKDELNKENPDFIKLLKLVAKLSGYSFSHNVKQGGNLRKAIKESTEYSHQFEENINRYVLFLNNLINSKNKDLAKCEKKINKYQLRIKEIEDFLEIYDTPNKIKDLQNKKKIEWMELKKELKTLEKFLIEGDNNESIIAQNGSNSSSRRIISNLNDSSARLLIVDHDNANRVASEVELQVFSVENNNSISLAVFKKILDSNEGLFINKKNIEKIIDYKSSKKDRSKYLKNVATNHLIFSNPLAKHVVLNQTITFYVYKSTDLLCAKLNAMSFSHDDEKITMRLKFDTIIKNSDLLRSRDPIIVSTLRVINELEFTFKYKRIKINEVVSSDIKEHFLIEELLFENYYKQIKSILLVDFDKEDSFKEKAKQSFKDIALVLLDKHVKVKQGEPRTYKDTAKSIVSYALPVLKKQHKYFYPIYRQIDENRMNNSTIAPGVSGTTQDEIKNIIKSIALPVGDNKIKSVKLDGGLLITFK